MGSSTQAFSQKGPSVDVLISQVQDALQIVARRLPEEQLPPLSTAEITLQTTISTGVKGGLEFFVITIGGKVEEEEVQQMVLTLSPPSPKAAVPAAKNEFSTALANAIVAAARGAQKAINRKPPLELAKLVANLSFVIKAEGEGGVKFVFAPVTLNFGGGVSRANMHKIELTFEGKKKG
jgi:hypothetical protein